MKKIFCVVSGEGLGICNTTHRVLEKNPIENEPIGQAKIRAYVNIASGNVVLQTPKLEIEELGGKLSLFFTYNSQAVQGQNWIFSVCKQLLNINTKGEPMTLREADGHLTSYTLNLQLANSYVANQVGEGRCLLALDDATKQWRWYDPKSHTTEYYDPISGLLLRRVDLTGRVTSFGYDQQQRLVSIDAPSGVQYVLEYNSQGVNLSYMEGDDQILLHLYRFDQQGRLLQEIYPQTNYSIAYSYFNTSSTLQSIQQTDGTVLNLNYDQASNNLSLWKITQLKYGTDNINTLDYSQSPLVKLSDIYNNNIYFEIDANQLINQVRLPTGYNGVTPQTQWEITDYVYSNGLLKEVYLSDGTTVQWTYDPVYNLKKTKTGPGNLYAEWYYRPGGNRPLLWTEVQYLAPGLQNALVTRYVYDDDYNNGYVFLRFKVSPAGRVTAYEPDVLGEVGAKRQYAQNLFDVSVFPPNVSPALTTLLEWQSQQDASQISLVEYKRNQRGQVEVEYDYTDVDTHGNGVLTDSMGDIKRAWTIFGDCTEVLERQDLQLYAKTNTSFDNLRRKSKTINALGQVQEWDYQDNQQRMIMTLPSGRMETQTWNAQGSIIQNHAEVFKELQLETRDTAYRRDKNGLAVITIPPTLETVEAQLPREHCFYDRQYRPGFTVTRMGRVTETRYDVLHRYVMTITYSASINVSQLYLNWPPQPNWLPVVSRLIQQLPAKPGLLDQVTLLSYSLTKKLQYSVDAESYLTEYQYDGLDRCVAKIIYAEKLTDNEWQNLLQGITLNRSPDPSEDTITRTFYGADDEAIATQDAAGFVTQFCFDAAGRKVQKILYHIPVSLLLDWKAILQVLNERAPVEKAKDAYTYFYYDSRSQIIAEVDPNQIYTARSFYPNAKPMQEVCYATPLTNLAVVNVTPNAPAPSPEDQVREFYYDLLKRLINVDEPFGKSTRTSYDISNNVILTQMVDRLNPYVFSANFQRNSQAIFDGWNQATQLVNLLVGQKLADIDADSNLTPQQKQDLKQIVWLENSTGVSFDATGLKLKTRDSEGGITVFYYDLDLRPIFSVDPTGIVQQFFYDNFNNILCDYRFANRVPQAQLITLQGGLITQAIQSLFASLRDPANDRVINKTYDRRNLVTENIDAEGYISTIQWNALQLKYIETIPVSDNAHTMTITHLYEGRGLETSTIKIAQDLSIVTHQRFNNPYGKRTDFIDELYNHEQYDYDHRGDLSQFTDAEKIIRFIKKYDAFRRIQTETNSQNDVITHVYNQQQRSHTIQYPVTGYSETKIQDIFGQVIVSIDGLGNIKLYTHTAHGLFHTETTALNQTTVSEYNLLGYLTQKTLANGSVSIWSLNASQQITQETHDVNGFSLVTNYVPNAFGDTEKIIDPNLAIVENIYDKRGLCVQSIKDPTTGSGVHLNLRLGQTYNAQKTLTSQSKGDLQNPNLYQQNFTQDALNRDTGDVIDPNGLNLVHNKHLNAAGYVVAEQDANGNIVRSFYDARKLKRFQVDAKGGVLEWNYDSESRLWYERKYNNAVDPTQLSDATSLTTLMTMLTINSQDGLLYHFYDAAEREVYTVNSQGAISETVYDNAANNIRTIKYSDAIDPTTLATQSTATIQAFTQAHAANPANRTSYVIFDAANQPCFTIDPDGYIVENRYNATGQRITEIQYATQVTNPSQIAQLPVDQVESQLVKDASTDRITWHIFDSLGRPWFDVKSLGSNGQGAVIGYQHDNNGNLTQVCLFSTAVVLPADNNYAEIVALCQQKTPDPSVDRITTELYDADNRRYKTTNALGYFRTTNWDAVSNKTSETNENSVTWTYTYDAAKREKSRTTPARRVTTVTQVNNNPRNTLTSSETSQALVQQKTYDNLNNVTSVIEAQGTAVQRTISMGYDADSLCQTTSMVTSVDDPTQAASLAQRPEKQVTLTKQSVRDAQQRTVVDKDYNDEWTFYIFDSESREIYRVMNDGQVIGTSYTIFGEKLSETDYDNLLGIDLTPYQSTGIPLTVLQGALVPSANDRTTIYGYDKRSNQTSETKPEVFYYLSDAKNGSFGTANPVLKKQYNAFGEVSYTAVLIDPVKQIWARRLTWFDTRGNTVATCDSLNRVTRKTWSVLNTCDTKSQWYQPPSINPDQTTTLAELDQAYQPNTRDREFTYLCDLMGRRTQKILLNVTPAQLILAPGTNIPSLQNLPVQDVIKSWQYSPTGKVVAFTNAAKQTCFAYYDSTDLLIAQTGMPRTTLSGKTLIPFTYYGNDAFGVAVAKTKYANGVSNPVVNQLPVAVLDPVNDQVELTLTNPRGKASVKQNEEGFPVFMTYTSANKEARHYNPITSTAPVAEQKKEPPHVDMEFFYGSRNTSSHLNFSTWYHPDTCHYLLQMTENRAQCLRVLFSDSPNDDNTTTFKTQLEKLIVLSRVLNKPAIFISKEPGANNHFILGLVRGKDLILINPLGIFWSPLAIFKRNLCYQTLAELKRSGIVNNIWLSSSAIQQQRFEPNLVSCGPIVLELASHILKNFSLVQLNQFWDSLKTNEPSLHHASQLTYFGTAITALLPENLSQVLRAANQVSYRAKILSLRQKHGQELNTLIQERANTLGVSPTVYLQQCRNSSVSQVLFESLLTTDVTAENLQQMPEYSVLETALGQPENRPQNARTTPTTQTLHLDESRTSYDNRSRPNKVQVLRDNNSVQVSTSAYNTHGEVVAAGDGLNWCGTFERDKSGAVWKSNKERGGWSIELNDLQKRNTIKIKAANGIDLSTKNYTDLTSLLQSTDLQIERTESERDPVGRITIKRGPAYEAVSGPTNIPLNVYAGNDYISDFGPTSLNWLVPQETNVTPCFTIYRNDNDTKLILPIVTKNGRCGVELSPLVSDIYQYEITYTLTSVPGSDPIYISKGIVQFDSKNNIGSIATVPIVVQDNQVRLAGNTLGITAIKIWQGINNLIAQVPVTYNTQQQAWYADLSHLASGNYTLSAVSTQISNPKTSLPFTIYTTTPALQPLSREIGVTMTLKWLSSHVQVEWLINPAFSNCQIKLACVYTGVDGQAHIHEDTITPGQYIADYTDADGHVLHCNSEFEVAISSIDRLDVLLVLDSQGTTMVLLANEPPLAQANKTKKLAPNLKQDANLIQTAGFAPHHLVCIAPIANPLQYVSMQFKDMQLDAQANWKVIAILGTVIPCAGATTSPGVVIDVSKLAYGNYPFILGTESQIYKNLLHAKDQMQGTFTVARGGAIFSGDPVINPMQAFRPTWQNIYDRYDNCISETDSLGNTTTKEYDPNNNLIKIIQPQISVTDEHGQVSVIAPTTVYGPNILNQMVGETDANGHTHGYVLNTDGKVMIDVLGDGTLNEQNDMDIFNRILTKKDDQGNIWTMIYNRRNQLLSLTTPTLRVFRYGLDECDNRNMQQLPSGATYYYIFDPFNNIIGTYLPQGQLTTNSYDRNHVMTTQHNPDGTVLTRNTDYFGVLISSTDLGGTQYAYVYDWKRQLREEYISGGPINHGIGAYLSTGWNYYQGGYYLQTMALPNKHLQYLYQGNWLVQVNDLASQQQTIYSVNTEGQRETLTVTGPNNQLIRQASAQYNALGDETLIYDNKFTMQIDYDAVNNRRRMQSALTIQDILNRDKVISYDSWFDTDGANRLTTFNGILSNNQIIPGGQGMSIQYQGNLRHISSTATTIQTLSYDGDSRLTSAQTQVRDPYIGWILGESQAYTWHPDDYVKSYGDTQNWWDEENQILVTKSVAENIHCDPNGWIDTDSQVISQTNQDTLFASTSYTLDQNIGITRSQTTQYYDPSHPDTIVVDNLNSSYVAWDSQQLATLGGTRTVNDDPPSPYASSEVIFTPNGQTQATIRGGEGPLTTYIYQTYDGIPISSVSMSPFYATQGYFLHTLQGELLASYQAKAYGNNPTQFSILADYFQPISDSFPPKGPQRYVVQSGDTWASIAQRFYGDSGFASKLAFYCGYMDSSVNPSQGQNLLLPQMLPLRNRIGVSVPFDTFMGILIGSLIPHLSTPQPKAKRQHHSFWKTLVEAFVGTVVAILLPELLPAIGSLLVAAVTGAIASAASQGVAIALHDQNKFSWKLVVEGALQQVLLFGTARLEGVSLMGQGLAEYTKAQFIKVMLVYGQVNVETQLEEMALGLRHQFNWEEIVAAAVDGALSDFASYKFAPNAAKLTELQRFTRNLLVNEVDSLTAGVVQHVLLRQRFDLANIEAQALGTTVGNEVGTIVRNEIEEYRRAQAASRALQEARKEAAQREAANNNNNSSPSSSSSSAQAKQLSKYGLFNQKTAQVNPSLDNYQNQSGQDLMDALDFGNNYDMQSQVLSASSGNDSFSLRSLSDVGAAFADAYTNLDSYKDSAFDILGYLNEYILTPIATKNFYRNFNLTIAAGMVYSSGEFPEFAEAMNSWAERGVSAMRYYDQELKFLGQWNDDKLGKLGLLVSAVDAVSEGKTPVQKTENLVSVGVGYVGGEATELLVGAFLVSQFTPVGWVADAAIAAAALAAGIGASIGFQKASELDFEEFNKSFNLH